MDDVRRIAEQERLQKINMVGYSFGGYVALAYAAAYPASLRSLALVSTNFMNPLRYGPFSAFTSPALAFANTMAWLTYPQRRAHYYYYEHGKATSYFNSTFKGLLTMPLAINFWMLAQTLRLDLAAALPARHLPRPHLSEVRAIPILRNARSRTCSAQMKNARAVTLAGSSHFIASQNIRISLPNSFCRSSRIPIEIYDEF